MSVSIFEATVKGEGQGCPVWCMSSSREVHTLKKFNSKESSIIKFELDYSTHSASHPLQSCRTQSPAKKEQKINREAAEARVSPIELKGPPRCTLQSHNFAYEQQWYPPASSHPATPSARIFAFGGVSGSISARRKHGQDWRDRASPSTSR